MKVPRDFPGKTLHVVVGEPGKKNSSCGHSLATHGSLFGKFIGATASSFVNQDSQITLAELLDNLDSLHRLLYLILFLPLMKYFLAVRVVE